MVESEAARQQRLFVKNARNLSGAGASTSGGSGAPARLVPSTHPPTSLPPSASGCPVIGQGAARDGADGPDGPDGPRGLNEKNMMPVDNNKPVFDDKTKPLDATRAVSSIPTASGEASGENWVYPSPQMFYNAMRRKNWQPAEEDMNAIVAIHNATNERVWSLIRMWEAEQGCAEPRLVRFRGCPKDYSPKARMLNLFANKRLPFDRHDWIVERCGRGEVRYVIDFYSGAVAPGQPAAMHLDVRPALDSPALLAERLIMQFKHMVSMLSTGRPGG